jgi:DNA-binding transcriptional LysR family regulator
MTVHPKQLRLLAVLDALLSERHVTRAAARLHLSQPATSSALAQLRAIYQDPLLVRDGRSLVLTPRAAQLLPDVRAALAAAGRVFAPVEAFDAAKLQRRFHLAVSDAVGQVLMPMVMRRLTAEAPGVALRLSAAPAEVPASMLADPALDMVVAHVGRVDAGLRSTTLARLPLVAVARCGHPAFRGRRMTLAQFIAQQHVVVFPHEAAVEDALRPVYQRARKPFRLLASAQSLAVVAAIVAETDAIALMSEPLARRYCAQGQLQVLRLPAELRLPPVPVRALWHERSQADPAHAWMRALVKECAAEV